MGHRGLVRGVLFAILLIGSGGVASADELSDRLIEEPAAADRPSISHRIKDKLNQASNVVGLHLRVISAEALDLGYDAHKNQARVGVQAGPRGTASFGLDSNVEFKPGKARFNTRLHLGLMGKQMDLELPTFEVVSRSYKGDSYVELRVPVVDMTF